MRILPFKKEKFEVVEYCLECEYVLHKVEGKDEVRVCINHKCTNYQIEVTDWYNFEREI